MRIERSCLRGKNLRRRRGQMKLIVGISGASGVIYGVRFLEALNRENIETHLVLTPLAEKVLEQETNFNKQKLIGLATYHYQISDLTAPISSGSFLTQGMIIIPCSMKTLAGIACGYSDNLLLRAADVTLKEKRTLIIVPRETPLRKVHLENMLRLANEGATILPAMPGFYHNPKLDDVVNHIVGKVLDILGIDHKLYHRWKNGIKE
jgi:4-hydroxy-3-polyprenylbenzoate decarboxylase